MFINILKRRLWRRYTLVGKLIALITILLTFYVRGYEDLQYYHNLAHGKYDFLMTAEQEPVLNEEAIVRSNTTRLEMEKSSIYSFDSVC